jgi:predicted 2-oxoglutarate/Fe(II)-dependent dioxygenase YbiX
MTFPTNIKDFAKVYDNVFSKDFCDETIKKLKNSDWTVHQFYNNVGQYVHVGDDFLQSRLKFKEQEEIDKELWNVIYKYIMVDLSSFYEKFQWFGGWKGYTSVKFHRYTEGTNMKLHCDHIHDIFDGERKGVPILTVVGLLNDNFEGGDFMLWEKEKINLSTGSVLVFPSNFMYPHEVSYVTKGERYSFVSWVF